MKKTYHATALVCIAVFWLNVFSQAAPGVSAAPPNFQDDIKPLFRDHCLKCHNADEANADLDLSTFESTMRGGSSGKAVLAGRPESSQLFRAVAHLDAAEPMPPESDKLSEAKIDLIRKWIQAGLIAGKGQKSQLRSIAMAAPAKDVVNSPMPRGLATDAFAMTVRPPMPQTMDASPGAPLLATSGQEQVLVYGISKGDSLELLGSLPFPEGTIHTLRFSPHGTLLLAAGGRGGHSGRVVIFDVAGGERIAELAEEVDSILAADIDASHKFVALGGPSKAVAIFDTSSGNQLHRIKKHTDWITSLAFSPDGKLLATGDRSGGIHVWESDRGAIVYSLDEYQSAVTGLAWRPDAKVLASVAEDGNLILWDMSDGWQIKNVTAHQKKSDSRYSRSTGVIDIDFSSAGTIATIGRDRMLRVFNAEAELISEKPTAGLPVSLTFLAGGKRIAVGSFDGTLQLWSLDQAEAVATTVNGR